MRVLVFQCDWCGVQQPPSDAYHEAWPEGWSNLEEIGLEDLLCRDCRHAARNAVNDAIATTKAQRARLPIGTAK